MSNLDTLHARAKALNLHGVLAHWAEATAAKWVGVLLDWEEQERARRSLERRLRSAHIGRFKPICDFDWSWPKRCDRSAFEALLTLDFLKDATNVILVGPNGVGKSTLARNIGSRKPRNVPSSAPRNAGGLSHDQIHCGPAAHHRPADPDLLDA